MSESAEAVAPKVTLYTNDFVLEESKQRAITVAATSEVEGEQKLDATERRKQMSRRIRRSNTERKLIMIAVVASDLGDQSSVKEAREKLNLEKGQRVAELFELKPSRRPPKNLRYLEYEGIDLATAEQRIEAWRAENAPEPEAEPESAEDLESAGDTSDENVEAPATA